MFSVFREWWILRQLTKRCMKKDVRILSNGGDINEYGHISKEKFLNEISAKFLGIIPRTKYWQMRLIRKYRGTLEISKKRNPYYAVEGFDGTKNCNYKNQHSFP